MKKLLLIEEINRTKKLMLLEGIGDGVRRMFMDYSVTYGQRGKICDDLLAAGVDDSTVTLLRGKGRTPFDDEFVDEVFNQLDTLSRGTNLGETSQFHRMLKGLSKSIGLDTKLDDVLRILKDNTKTDVEKATAKTVFLANFRDAQIQDFFKKNIDQIDSDNVRLINNKTLQGVVKGKLDDIAAGKQLDAMFEGTPLTRVERFAIRKGRIKNQAGDLIDDSMQPKPVAIIEHMYNYAKQIQNVTFGRGAKALAKQEELVQKVYNRLVNVINIQSKNQNFSDIQAQFAQLWNELNNIRLLQQTKGDNFGGIIKPNDLQFNTDIFEEFTQTLTKQGVPYEMVNKLKTWWGTASPMTRNTWTENYFKNTAFAKFLGTKNPISDLINGLTQMWTSTIGVLVDKGIDVLISGNPMWARREQIVNAYKRGIFVPKGSYKIKGKKIIPKIGGVYSQWVQSSLMSIYFFVPLVITLAILAKDTISVLISLATGGGTEAGDQSYIEYLRDRAISLFTSHIIEKGVWGNIKTFLGKLVFPFNPLGDDVLRGLWDIISETKDVVFTSTDTLIARIKSLVMPIWRQILSTYESTKNEIQDRIDQTPQDSTTTPVYQDTIIPDTSGFVEG